ncbi:MAG: hypothetical protein IJ899_09440 [Blautia sp.]|nr:hypothetical protein [Blautia sp.]
MIKNHTLSGSADVKLPGKTVKTVKGYQAGDRILREEAAMSITGERKYYEKL